MAGSLEDIISTLITRIEKLETKLVSKIEIMEEKLEKQASEINELKEIVEKLIIPTTKEIEITEETTIQSIQAHLPPTKDTITSMTIAPMENSLPNNPPNPSKFYANNKTRRTFLKRLAGTGLVTLGASLIGATTGQKEAKARILVNPTDYPLQFGAISTPQGTTISGQLQDTTVRIGLAACGDPGMDYNKLPLFDTGVFAQGAGYGLYATTDKSMGTGGYFRNIAPAGVGPGYAIAAISDNGTAISGTGTNSGFGVSGICNGTGSGVSGNSTAGYGVTGTSNNGVGLRGISDSGVPLRLQTSSSVPTSGNRVRGDIYLDTLGKVYVWARNDGNSADIWRQVQFVPA